MELKLGRKGSEDMKEVGDGEKVVGATTGRSLEVSTSWTKLQR